MLQRRPGCLGAGVHQSTRECFKPYVTKREIWRLYAMMREQVEAFCRRPRSRRKESTMADTEKKPAAEPAFANAPHERAFKAARTLPTGAAAQPDPAKFGVEGCCPREFWAVIESDGSLVRGRNVVRTGKTGTGQYSVVFTADISKGVFVATIGSTTIGTASPGQIFVANRCCPGSDPGAYNPFELLGQLDTPPLNRHAVGVDTHDTNGNFSDRPFHLIVLTQ